MSRAALFYDIDGTLTDNHTGQIQASALEAIAKAQAKGHLAFINTGRTLCSIHPEIRKLQVDGFLCGCGTHVFYHGEDLFHRTIDGGRRRKLARDLAACSIEGVLEGRDDLVFTAETTRFPGLEAMRIRYNGMGLGLLDKVSVTETVYDKFFIVTDAQSDVPGFFASIEDMEIIDRRRGRYEIVPKGFSKATAIQFVQDRFDIAMDDVYVFGDSANDLSMFTYAKHTVAMGEHAHELDPYTEFVTKNAADDGIAFAMKHYGLI